MLCSGIMSYIIKESKKTRQLSCDVILTMNYYFIKGFVMLHPTIDDDIGFRWRKKNQIILVFLLRIYDLYFQICIKCNLDIETVYKLFI